MSAAVIKMVHAASLFHDVPSLTKMPRCHQLMFIDASPPPAQPWLLITAKSTVGNKSVHSWLLGLHLEISSEWPVALRMTSSFEQDPNLISFCVFFVKRSDGPNHLESFASRSRQSSSKNVSFISCFVPADPPRRAQWYTPMSTRTKSKLFLGVMVLPA